MPLDNLPGITSTKLDGNIQPLQPAAAPVTLVIGTAQKGTTSSIYHVNKFGDAIAAFGSSGTLVRGMVEAADAGATNINLFRIGAKGAALRSIIAGKVTVTTVQQDRFAKTDFQLKYVAVSGTLTIQRVALQGVAITPYNVYVAVAGATPSTDTKEVLVDGTWAAADGVNLDATSTFIALNAVPAVAGQTPTSVFYDGTDGTDLSRVEMWEELYKAYYLLQDQAFDLVTPMDVYLDDKNIVELTDTAIGLLSITAQSATLPAYPVAGTTKDVLGKVYAEEYNGEFRFWWTFSKADAVAEFWPAGGIGSASATLKTSGTTLVAADFHEVNFAYQLAEFASKVSEQENECHGVIGVKPPLSTTLKDLATWLGKAPIVNASNVITTNGTGLLGNKWMAGRATLGTDIPGLVINNVDGAAKGGFIRTDTGFADGVQQKDANNKLVDNGKYLSVVSAHALLSNVVNASYSAPAAAAYAGFITTLPVESAPTNKVLPSVGLQYVLNVTKIDALAGAGYVQLQSKRKGVVVADAPTAARPDSDYKRLSTNRIVKAAVDAVRAVSEPFLGEGLSGTRMAALDTAQEQILTKLQKAGLLKRYEKRLSATPTQAALGQATVELQLVPAFELRKIAVIVSLAKQ